VILNNAEATSRRLHRPAALAPGAERQSHRLHHRHRHLAARLTDPVELYRIADGRLYEKKGVILR